MRGLRLARVPAAETEAAIAALRSRPDVLYAEPNYVRRKFAAPDDTRYAEQWALRNSAVYGGGPGADIDAELAWNVTTGDRSVVVGVVDEGVDVNHVDLRPNIWRNPGETPGNGVDDDGNGYADDVNGWDFFHNDASVYDGKPAESGLDPFEMTDAHGTHVAGIVGAAGNNSQGVAGVNWQVSLMSLKILGAGFDEPAPSSVLLTVRAYAYAKALRDLYVDSNGTRGANVRVLNNSYGGYGRSQAEIDAIRALNDSGILFVAAAGNANAYNEQVPAYPANYDLPNLISVAATDRTDVLANFSNRGNTTVHMSAPGVDILSTTPFNGYTAAAGTSMAAPHVAGAAALLCARRPEVSVARMRAALLLSGEYTGFLGFNTVTGRRLNAHLALQNLDSADAPPPSAPTNLRASLGSREIRLSWNAPGDDGVSGRATLYEIRYSDADLTVPSNFASALKVAAPPPAGAFTPEGVTFNAFYGRSTVYVGVRALDEAGNAGPVTQVRLDLDPLAVDPYVVRESAAEPLSTGGTALGLSADDEYKSVALPFSFPFYGFNTSSVSVSTNGTIYPVRNLYPPVTAEDLCGDADCYGTVDFLTGNRMIAAAWDDLRTDLRPGDDVYMVQPDADRVIFRWQGVTFDTPFFGGGSRGEHPVSFEVELRRDGTVVTRYGAGNQSLFPVVGLSDGVRLPYVAASHTSEESPKNLTNAPTVTFERRRPDTSPAADIRLTGMTADANPVSTGKRLTYSIFLINYGTLEPATTVTDALPPGTNFVSCSVPPFGGATCAGPAPGTNGTVTFNFPALRSGLSQSMSVTVDVVAPAGTTLTNTATASSSVRDPDTSNNSASVTTAVVGGDVFTGAKQLAARGYHTLALKGDGTVWGWGENRAGQVYDGTKDESRNLPAQVAGVSGAAAVAAGAGFGLALRGDGTVWGWGNIFNSYTPTQVAGVAGVTQLVSGTIHAAALLGDTTVRAWGSNDQGQVGDGTNAYRSTWVEVSGLTRVSTPTVTPDGGTFWPAVDVTVRCATPGAVMRYTVNSFQDPTESDPVIADGTTLRLTSNPSRIRVRAWKDGMPTSPVKEAYFSIFNSGSFPPMPNPIDTPHNFVEQHYRDFLSRDPDQSGLSFWTSDITSCGTNAQCVEVRRVNVSAAFFLSIEFQETGYFVYRLEKAAFDRLPRFRQFMADTRQAAGGVVVNAPGWREKLDENKRAFAELWVRRVDFKALYDPKSNAEYVDALFANAGLSPADDERRALVAGLDASTETRGSVLRKVADAAPDSDFSGYNFWLSKLDSFGGDWNAAEMVKAFVSSTEYRKRFGQP